jgi:hypothetical protein
MNKGDLAYSAVGDCKRNPIRNILKWVPVVREVGYARSSADGKDNITFPERRGISSEMILRQEYIHIERSSRKETKIGR